MSRRSRFFSAQWRRPRRKTGWDVVRTPFGERFVERGAGFREAAKWALVRLLGYAVLLGLAYWAVQWAWHQLAPLRLPAL